MKYVIPYRGMWKLYLFMCLRFWHLVYVTMELTFSLFFILYFFSVIAECFYTRNADYLFQKGRNTMSIFELTSINRQSENTQEQISAHRTDIYLWALWKSSKRAKTQSRQGLEGGERKDGKVVVRLNSDSLRESWLITLRDSVVKRHQYNHMLPWYSHACVM